MIRSRTSSGQARRLLAVVAVPVICALLAPQAFAQHKKTPRPGGGLVINSPSGQKRPLAVVEFHGETVGATMARVLNGQPKVVTTKLGTEVINRKPSSVSLLLSLRDKDGKAKFVLPTRFKNSIVSLWTPRGQAAVWQRFVGQSFKLDVPKLLQVARLLNFRMLRLEFHMWNGHKVELQTVKLRFHLGSGLIQLDF